MSRFTLVTKLELGNEGIAVGYETYLTNEI
jgi:hypothetical protein